MRHNRPVLFAMSALLLGAAVLPAQGHERPAVQQAQAPGHNPLECYCRANGRIYAPGEQTCLRTPQGTRLAQCEMVTNIMSWEVTSQTCPDS